MFLFNLTCLYVYSFIIYLTTVFIIFFNEKISMPKIYVIFSKYVSKFISHTKPLLVDVEVEILIPKVHTLFHALNTFLAVIAAFYMAMFACLAIGSKLFQDVLNAVKMRARIIYQYLMHV